MANDMMRNGEGYFDPTAYYGTKEIVREENEMEKMNRKLIHTFRFIVDLAGFEIVGRVTLRHKKSGRIFK